MNTYISKQDFKRGLKGQKSRRGQVQGENKVCGKEESGGFWFKRILSSQGRRDTEMEVKYFDSNIQKIVSENY